MSRLNGHANGPMVAVPIRELASGSIPDRLPPHHIEAEEGVLTSILLDNHRISEVLAILEARDFYRDSNQIIFEAMVDLYDVEQPIDPVSLEVALRDRGKLAEAGGRDALWALVQEGPSTAANCLYYAGIVKGHSKRRQVIDGATRLVHDAYSQLFSPEQLIDRMAAELSGVTAPENDEDLPLPGAWPEQMGAEAFEGIAGDLVRAIEPLTEADPAALLVQFLVAFGNACGHEPHLRIGASRHGVNLFACIVGRSSRARKGTSWDFIREVMSRVAPEWGSRRILSGLSSGEGMIEAVRDPKFRRQKVEGVPALGGGGMQDIEVDPGEPDKRALWIESEFGSTLTAKGRDGNLLEGKIKEFWEKGTVQSNSKANPSRTTDAHISIIGHVTIRELLRKLSDVDVSGGLANRFLWVCSRRTKLLPNPGVFRLEDYAGLLDRIKDALDGIALRRSLDAPLALHLSRDAYEAWPAMYHELGADRPGILDDLCGRAEPQTLRIAAIYALLEGSFRIELRHLNSALAVWRYSEASVRCIFGEHAHDNPDESRVIAALESNPSGLTTTDIRRRVLRKLSSDQAARILGDLVRSGRISRNVVKTAGRDRTHWVLNGRSQVQADGREGAAQKAQKAL